jgi:hypothetical protein
MDILEQLFIKKYSQEHTLIQEQIPGENISLFTLVYDVKLRHASARTGSCSFTDIPVILLLQYTAHKLGVY